MQAGVTLSHGAAPLRPASIQKIAFPHMPEQETAQRLLREYGDRSEQECLSRADYHEIQGNASEAIYWRKIADLVRGRRAG
jgi:hypothetical protein